MRTIFSKAAFLGWFGAMFVLAQAAHAFYDPSLGRWINRDPLAEGGGINLFRFVSNSPVLAVDYWGLREVHINLYYHNFNASKCVKDEVNRILQNCMKKCCKPKNGVNLNWVEGGSDPSGLQLGAYGGNGLGFNPTGYNAAVNANYDQTPAGASGGNMASVNPAVIAQQARNRGAVGCIALAMTIAHEVFHHIIGGTFGHYDDTGYVDSYSGSPGGELSRKACKELCDELDVD